MIGFICLLTRRQHACISLVPLWHCKEGSDVIRDQGARIYTDLGKQTVADDSFTNVDMRWMAHKFQVVPQCWDRQVGMRHCSLVSVLL